MEGEEERIKTCPLKRPLRESPIPNHLKNKCSQRTNLSTTDAVHKTPHGTKAHECLCLYMHAPRHCSWVE